MMNRRLAVEWEKGGNTWWVQCACEMWFPVSEDLACDTDARLKCPRCAAVFARSDARRVSDP